ncbi:MAG: DUF1449 family protein [Verrucomicrobiae bacterium]|nr:DUF1449 family protein [Verrucomicrobiae bacterium]
MHEVIQQATTWYTLPLTVLVGLLAFYWLLAIFGVISSDALDFDVDAGGPDLDLDAGVDADVDGDLDSGHSFDADHDSGGLGLAALKFLNFGQVPGMVVISVLIFTMWLGSMIGNFLFNAAGAALVAILIFVAVLFVGAILTKVFTLPLVPLFRSLNQEGDTHESIVGRECRVRSGRVTDEGGQAEVDREGASFLINVRVAPGREPLAKGDLALVVDHDEANQFFLIKSLKTD